MRLALWTLRARAPRLAARTAPAWIALLFAVVQLWDVLPWGAWAAALAGRPLLRSLVAVGLVGALARLAEPLDVDPPFRRVLPRAAVGPTLALAGMQLAIPALLAAFLFPGGPLLRLVGWSAASLWFSRGAFVVPALAVALGEQLGPARILVDVPLLLGVGFVPARGAVASTGGWRPRTAFTALVGRDLACLWRTDRGSVVAAMLAAPLPAVLVWGLRRNGGLDRAGLATAVGILLCALSPGAAAALGSVRARLGERFHPRAWPVAPRLRVASLVALFALWLLPSHVALAAAGGLAPALVPVPVVGMLAAGAAWLCTFATVNLGVYGAWALLALGLVLAGHPEVGVVLALPPLWHAARRLR